MSNTNEFIMLVGLVGGGKSTLAKELSDERDNYIHLSSDKLREEFYGDEKIQGDSKLIFKTMEERTKEYLKDGKSVVYDATNISRKKRKHLLTQLPKDVHKKVIYIATKYAHSVYRNNHRERVVPEGVIKGMYKTLQIPIESEGWNEIVFHYSEPPIFYDTLPKDEIKNKVLSAKDGYGLMEYLASHFVNFFEIYEMPQDSKYHSFSVSRHIYEVYKYVVENYEAEDEYDRELMLWTALLHDIGKYFCKSFINRKGEETRYANFIGHDYVGSQMAVHILRKLGYDDKFIHTVATLIQFHMYLLDANANKNKLKGYVGEELYKKLKFLRDADTASH